MSRTFNGIIHFPTNFDVAITRPLDSRLVVDFVKDLTNGSIEYPYQGMVVYVKETEKLYVLKTEGIRQSYDIYNWKVVDNKGNVIVDRLSNLTDGTIEEPYIGMMVYVIEDENIYVLKTNNPSSIDNWKILKSKGSESVDTLNDLLSIEEPYIGMMVYVIENENMYVLKTNNPDSLDNWKLLTGSGTPAPTTLEHIWYKGCTDTRFEDELPSRIKGLSSSNSLSGSLSMNKTYCYIAIAEDQNIVSVITDNNEKITTQFILKTTVSIDGVSYKLYEFFLDTLIPLDVDATIKITGNTN